MKYAAILEYDGTGFCGWQTQRHARNVQDCVDSALSKVADESVRAVCAGRTDAGVHAVGQVIHFETNVRRSPDEWRNGVNAQLPADVSVAGISEVSDDFHARFSAKCRRYHYIVLNYPDRRALLRRFTARIYRRLDAEAMHRSAQALVGEHDFSSFRGAGCQSASPVRRVISIDVRRSGNFVVIKTCADAFLQHMVRNIAGVLLAVGSGEVSEARVGEVLACRDRTQAGITAESCGLYLSKVEYDACYDLPEVVLSDSLIFLGAASGLVS